MMPIDEKSRFTIEDSEGCAAVDDEGPLLLEAQHNLPRDLEMPNAD
jgi:hypothetical protein